MHALFEEIIPASGIEFATSLKLTPSCLDQPGARHEIPTRVLCNLVLARSNILRIFEVREEPPPINARTDDERERRAQIRRGTEAVEGEVEMDTAGEGFSVGPKSAVAPTVIRFRFLREFRLHGIITGLEAVKIISSLEDKLERLLVSFRDAKIALLEWSDATQDLVTVSIHTYERAIQLISFDTSAFRADLRVDSLSRCAALSLPRDAIAVLPFYQTQAEIDIIDQDVSQTRDVPYSLSFILDLPADVDPSIQNVIDFVFLPGFHNPTVAVLFQTKQTWTGRLNELKDTTKLVFFTLDVVARQYPVIGTVEGLPYDALYLLPCATTVGGVIVVTANSVVLVEQSSRKFVLPVNGWLARTSDIAIPPLSEEEQKRDLQLEGSKATFIDEKTLFLILKDGSIYPIEIVFNGRVASKLAMAPALAQTTIPSVVQRVSDEVFFVGSNVGPAILLKADRVEEDIEQDAIMADVEPKNPPPVNDGTEMDDDDDDIYGVSGKPDASSVGVAQDADGSDRKKRSVIHLLFCDSLPAHGPVSDMTFSMAMNGITPVPELVTATGAGHLGGFTLFQRDLPVRTKRKLHVIGGARGMWSLPIRQPVKTSGGSYERAINPHQTDIDSVIISTDANPSPGFTRVATRTTRGELQITKRITGTAIGAAPFFQRTAILHVMTNAIRVLEPDGTERQIIKDMDGNAPRSKIRACYISDPFVLVFREDDTIGLFIGEAERGKIRRKDMSPMGDKTSRYYTGCFFTDTSGLFSVHHCNGPSPTNGTTSTLQSVVNASNSSQWLVLVRPQGVMEIWTLPKLTLVFSTSTLAGLDNVLSDSHMPPALSKSDEPTRKPQEFDVEMLLLANLGESYARPHLFVLLRTGQMAIYEAVQDLSSVSEPLAAVRDSTLKIKFVKTSSKAYEFQKPEESERSIITEQKKISRVFIPFTTRHPSGAVYSGVFFTGDNPHWILSTDKAGVQIYPSEHSVVYSFAPCSIWETSNDFLLYTEQGPILCEWIPEFQFHGPMPSRSVPRGKPYSNIVFDPSTSLIVAASSLKARFASFDEDGNQIWAPDAPNISDPSCECSALELISPDLWVTMDGYEFATNEFVNALACVTLETASTESGTKQFIAVGTSIVRGEDLAVKGATYIFDIIEVVSDPSLLPKRWYKLRLRCRDDAKGPVTALCNLNGYLVSSMGQKIFVRAFDLDERLVGVAFMDVGLYVTSLRTLKNLLLIGDAVKSVMFVAFQEDPFKLILLGKDVNPLCVTCTDFFFAEKELAIVTFDESGVIRLYDYNPGDVESRDGRLLILNSEFHSHAEYRASSLIAQRIGDDTELPQSKLILGSTDGAVSCLTPVHEASFKRLGLLQGQLTRNIQQVAGLNPKAMRLVRNESMSRPTSKGILDGNLLRQFETLPIARQQETTKQIGAERTIVLHDWIDLSNSW
ncbi:hypothetical protein FISHEDRAFT_56503 [Fistulina hepatica ATCC 64428]|uniref:Cleavage/polyadenylation specificity factor A subunit C-terminal domain-containing protein n=1 Tax=Fistulina hepatica ATCC 64428 TaxID=1128425 RepID=A0A0D7AIK0_9AGAR|nr:hypothetical protein FISHEDRAFT_56503 [Fistulina hepatica ATCC 64428]